MKGVFAFILVALSTQVSAAPTGNYMCGRWTVTSLEHTMNQKPTFASNDQVTLKWDTRDSRIEYISSVGLFSAKTNEFLHTQYRSYPGVNAANGELTFDLTVPLCLQRESDYYLEVYASTSGADSDCSLQTLPFKLTPDPNGDYSVCDM